MKTKLLITLLISISFINSASAQWVQQNSNTFIPYPRFFGVHFINSSFITRQSPSGSDMIVNLPTEADFNNKTAKK